MWHYRFSFLLFFASSVSIFLPSCPIFAQIIPDDTLGNESSSITPNVIINEVQADLIEGGSIRENNLFHSFSDFNIPDGKSAYFASPQGVTNILTRITGNNVSNIFGTLGVDGAANREQVKFVRTIELVRKKPTKHS